MDLDHLIERMESLGWRWDASQRLFTRPHGLRLTIPLAAEHVQELDRPTVGEGGTAAARYSYWQRW